MQFGIPSCLLPPAILAPCHSRFFKNYICVLNGSGIYSNQRFIKGLQILSGIRSPLFIILLFLSVFKELRFVLLVRQRRAEQIALCLSTAHFFQYMELFLRFYSFRGRTDSHLTANIDQ